MSLAAIKKAYGVIGLYLVQELQVRISRNQTQKLKISKDVVKGLSDQLDLTNIGGLGKIDKFTSQQIFRLVLDMAVKKKIFYIKKIGKKESFWLTVPVPTKSLKEVGIAPVEPKKFVKPLFDDVKAYFKKKKVLNHETHAKLFYAHYESNGWKVGKVKMVNWKGAAAGWITRGEESGSIQLSIEMPVVIPDDDNSEAE